MERFGIFEIYWKGFEIKGLSGICLGFLGFFTDFKELRIWG